ncbi:membrane-bound glycerophospholipid O-acyltransferase 2-like [Saccoglossus kowalevskii]|uniref:Lysophospholipid acyltransferase 2-like n=1 Tax=Saccoglossus kowalevskii TaxID=10224 RepID=A0ABM0M6A2_SACKO|nr:PREDICTED: lysophospholipid acyltransferase 2-like [Saccoglossus kowalevskii]
MKVTINQSDCTFKSAILGKGKPKMAPGLWPLMLYASKISGLGTDQVNYAFFQVTGLFLAIGYRQILHPHRVSPTVRHVVAATIGIYMAVFSYSWSSFHLFAQSTIPYIMMRTMNPQVIHKFVFTFSIAYMSAVHISQQYQNINIYLMDHIGPMMVMTEKVTSLAFSLHDGLTKDDSKLNSQQREMATKKMPTIIEYYSYIFYFQALAVGPVCFYNDYIDFIKGKHLVPYVIKTKDGKEVVVHKEPPVLLAVIKKLLFSALMVVILLTMVPRYPLMGNFYNIELLNSSLLNKFIYLWISVEVAKSKYFFAWTYADALNNASGLGFNGYDKNGNPKWDLVTNINIKDFELSTSLKVLIDNWNTQTRKWLRYVCYDRVPFQKTLFTFILSSIWHGFQPGYFWTFFQGAYFTYAGRKVRYTIRPFFQDSKAKKILYDMFTWLGTQILLSYLVLPFTLLNNSIIIQFYSSMYFCIHILAALFIILFPTKKRPSKTDSDNNSVTDTHAILTANNTIKINGNCNGPLNVKKMQ